MPKLALALTLASLLLVPSSTMQIQMVDTGTLLAYLPTRDGGGMTVTYQADGYLSFTMIYADNSFSHIQRVAVTGMPVKLIAGACGKFMHFVASFQDGFVYRYRVELQGESGGCQMNEIYLPVVQQ